VTTEPTRPIPVARRRRGWVALLLVVGLLGLVLLALDRAADLVSERAVARAVQQQQGLTRPPTVSISGFPFLTQAVAGRFEQVDLTAVGVPAGTGLTVDQVQVRLAGVQARGSDLLAGRTDGLTADRLTIRAVVGYRSIDEVVADRLASDQLVVRFGAGGNGRLAVRGTIGSQLGDLSVQGLMRVQLVDGGVRLRLDPGSVRGLPAAAFDLLGPLLNLTIESPNLVSGVRPTGLAVGPDGITLTAVGTNVLLSSLA
jgi:LmeA-like phospholipid-binding